MNFIEKMKFLTQLCHVRRFSFGARGQKANNTFE